MRLARLIATAALVAAPAAAPAATVAAPSQTSSRQGVPLPARAPKGAPVAGKACTVGGFTGVLMPGSSLCVKIGGFVRAETRDGGGPGRH